MSTCFNFIGFYYRRQEEKGMTKDEMDGWHHRLDGHEFEQALGDGDEERSLECSSRVAKSWTWLSNWADWTDMYRYGWFTLLNSRNWHSGLKQLFPDGSVGKGSVCNAGDTVDKGSIPGLQRSPGEGSDHPLQYSCLGHPKHRGAWWATVRGAGHVSTTKHTHSNFLK